MFKEYDVVFAVRDLTKIVLKGLKGVILMVYDSTSPYYEVEFIDEDGNTIEILTVSERDIEISTKFLF
ncbi:MAG: hypothetical protein K0S04_3806 [Herbinix sp.]|nr:hypothetical protein [Herbinix sp.]